MIGAIIGDIAGSRFEGKKNVPADFEFFHEDSKFTDDTVHTIAIAKALEEHIQAGHDLTECATKILGTYGRRYLWCGCGDMFYKWLFADKPQPYGSYGNGSVMRVSPCAYFATSLEEAKQYAEIVTNITHNEKTSICGAVCITEMIYLLRNGVSKEEIYERVQKEGLYTPKSIIPDKFDVTTEGTVNVAIQCLMTTDDFESCVRKAVCYGGDADTNGAVAGSLAEACYSVPVEMKAKAYDCLDEFLRNDYHEIIQVLDHLPLHR